MDFATIGALLIVAALLAVAFAIAFLSNGPFVDEWGNV